LYSYFLYRFADYAASQTPAVEVSVDEAPLSMSIRFRDNDLRLKVHLSAEDPNNPGLSTAEAGGDSIATDEDLERIRRAICTCKSIPLVTQWWFAKIY
jgi:hypothetical protein